MGDCIDPYPAFFGPDPDVFPLECYRTFTMDDGGKGFVYVLEAKNGLFKIGETMNLARRMPRNHKKWNGDFAFEVVAVIYSDNCYRLEQDLHLKYRNKRSNRGWFALSVEDVEYIKSLGEKS
jgi:predicted GIY-YIG superfamily endonuclease